MTKIRTFPNAPIVEAILDIRVRLPEHIKVEDLERIHKEVVDAFPTKEQKYSVQTEVKISSKEDIFAGDAQAFTKTDNIGYVFKSDIGKKIFQSRIDGFTFNKLKPYESWEVFFEEARFLWSIYKKIANPIEITRIALRYINKIYIPLPIDDFENYFLTAPNLPKEIPQGLSGFFMQYSIPNDKIKSAAIITQTIENPTTDNKLPYIFDIDVFIQGSFSDEHPSFWDNFNELRKYKNDIFFHCLTDKAKEMFK